MLGWFLLGRRMKGKAYSDGAGDDGKSGRCGAGGGDCLDGGGLCDHESSADDTLRILLEGVWLAELWADGVRRSSTCFHGSTTNGWYRCRDFIKGSLLGYIARSGCQGRETSRSRHSVCGHGSRGRCCNRCASRNYSGRGGLAKLSKLDECSC